MLCNQSNLTVCMHHTILKCQSNTSLKIMHFHDIIVIEGCILKIVLYCYNLYMLILFLISNSVTSYSLLKENCIEFCKLSFDNSIRM